MPGYQWTLSYVEKDRGRATGAWLVAAASVDSTLVAEPVRPNRARYPVTANFAAWQRTG